MSAIIRPEIGFAELERQHYDRLDEADRIEEEAIRAVDADPDEIPAVVSEEMLLDCVLDLFRYHSKPEGSPYMLWALVALWRTRMRDRAIQQHIDRANGDL